MIGVRIFWLAIFAATAAVASALYSQPSQARLRDDSEPELSIVEIAPDSQGDSAPVAKIEPPRNMGSGPATILTDHRNQRAFERALAPKPLVAAPDAGGVIEQAAGPQLVRMPDDALIVDRYWTITGGNGSPERPYQLTWDLLLSPQNSPDKDAPEGTLPRRVEFLNGKVVVVAGYSVNWTAAGPAKDFILADRLLDNCKTCKSRSMFATIAVMLTAPENFELGVLNAFTVRGTLKVSPVRENGSLVGVYSIENGEIVSRTR